MDEDRRFTQAPETIGAESVLTMASEMRTRFGWQGAEDGFTTERSWVKTSSQNRFHLVSSLPAAERFVLKLETPTEDRDAQGTFDAMTQLADILDSAQPGARGIRPLGWLAAPSVVATPYVEGVDLVDILKDPTHDAWQTEATVLGAIETTGAALATFHRSLAPDHAETSSTADSPRRLGRRLALPTSTAAVLAAEGEQTGPGRKYGDFGPGNIRLAADGKIFVLDPPTTATSALVHRDIAYFSFQVRKNLEGRGTGRTPHPDDSMHDRIGTAFLDGYASRSPFDPRSGTANALILAFEAGRAVGMTRKRIGQRQWSDARWAASTAFHLRSRAIRTAKDASG